jgi:flagellar hook-length control protein FliK
MNTSAVNSPANLLQPNTPNTGKQDAGSTSDAGSFNKMLSREMSSNTDNAKTNNTNNNNNINSSNNDVSKPAQKDSDSGNSTKNDANASAPDKTTADGKKADDDKVTSGKDVKKDDKDPDDKTAITDPTGIAAFVAALTSAKETPAETAVATAAVPDAKVALTDSDIKTKNDRIDIAAKILNSDGSASDKDAIGKKSDFVSALDKATANANDGGKTTAGSAKAEADIAAAATATAAQTVKVLDAAIGNAPQTFTAIAAAAAIQPRNDAQAMNNSTLLPPVGSDSWNDALGQKVVWMVKGAEQTATLTLNLPDLGPMQVTVNVSNNQATASFTAHQPEVRHALEASMPRLREMLNEAGIQLGQSSVNAGTPNQQGNGEGRQGSSGGRRAQSTDAIDSTVHVSHVPTPSSGSGMVDTFA